MNSKQISKKALLCGINYIGTSSQLSGCINDVNQIRDLLIKKYNYLPQNIIVMTDKTKIKPSKNNIIKKLKELILDKNSDQIYFHYSGHGTHTLDRNNDEVDSYDECLVPLDFGVNGMIVDDDLNKILQLTPENKKLVMVIDACNSGTVCDLKYKLDCLSVSKKSPNSNYNFEEWDSKFSITKNNQYVNIKPKIIVISGCMDDQTSADAYIDGKFQGALTYHFIKALELNNHKIKLKYLLKDIHCMLKMSHYSQKPVVESSNSINLDEEFEL